MRPTVLAAPGDEFAADKLLLAGVSGKRLNAAKVMSAAAHGLIVPIEEIARRRRVYIQLETTCKEV